MRYFTVCLLLIFSPLLWADDMRPASLTIKRVDASTYDVTWKVPIKKGVLPSLSVVFDSETNIVSPAHSQQKNNAMIRYWTFQSESGLAGSTISIEGLKGSTYQVLLRIIGNDQRTITTMLNTENTDYVVPQSEAAAMEDTAVIYSVYGIEHILVGFDHLLFVACLVYISRTRRKLFWAISGFTLAHSITLILAATDTLTVPIGPVEAVIALSIVFLACEITKNKKSSLSFRYPVLVSSSFGLLHGFGFASVLADIGLPETEKLLALLCFNLGVEIGQLLFVAVLFLSFILLSRFCKPLTVDALRLPASYFCGSLATIWMFERLAAF